MLSFKISVFLSSCLKALLLHCAFESAHAPFANVNRSVRGKFIKLACLLEKTRNGFVYKESICDGKGYLSVLYLFAKVSAVCNPRCWLVRFQENKISFATMTEQTRKQPELIMSSRTLRA